MLCVDPVGGSRLMATKIPTYLGLSMKSIKYRITAFVLSVFSVLCFSTKTMSMESLVFGEDALFKHVDLDGDGEFTYGDKYVLNWWVENGGDVFALLSNAEYVGEDRFDFSNFFSSKESFLGQLNNLAPVLNSTGAGGGIQQGACASACFKRGDSNGDCNVDGNDDPNHTLDHLYNGVPLQGTPDAADVDDDGDIDMADPIYLLDHFGPQGGPAPPYPYPDFGEDPTKDDNPPPPQPGDCDSEEPSDEDDTEYCDGFLEGPYPPIETDQLCSGSIPPPGSTNPEYDNPNPQPYPNGSSQPSPAPSIETPPEPTYVADTLVDSWRGGGSGLEGPTGSGGEVSHGGPVNVRNHLYDLYENGSSAGRSSEGFLRQLKRGSVEVGRLGLTWGEMDRSYPGIIPELKLEIGRRYFSRSLFDGQGSVGDRWYHSFYERLVVVSATKYRYVNWNSPYNDPDRYYTQSYYGIWEGPENSGDKIILLSNPPYPNATHKLEFRGGRCHYFDSQGRIVAREGRSGLDAIEFKYDSITGHLTEVVDSRGQIFDVEANSGYIEAIVDPEGYRIEYDQVGGKLDKVRYAQREVATVFIQTTSTLNNGGQGGGGGSCSSADLSYTTTTQTTERSFTYHTGSQLLNTIINSLGENIIDVEYQNNSTGRVLSITNANGGTWTFDEDRSNSLVKVTNPKGFQREYCVDKEKRPVAVKEFTQSTDPAYESRPTGTVPDYYEWQMVRGESCDCGRITEIIEPDGGKIEYTYDVNGDLLSKEKIAPPGQTGSILQSWTYDARGQADSYYPPHAYEHPNPDDYKHTMTEVADTDPQNPNGKIITLSTLAGNQHGAAVEWKWTYDNRYRLIEYEGPSHDGINPGDYHKFEYYGDKQADGDNAMLPKHQFDRRNANTWSELVYDANGNLVQVTQKNNQGAPEFIFNQTFDAEGFLTEWVGPSRGTQQYKIEFKYDAVGRKAVRRLKYYDSEPKVTGGPDPFVWIEDLYIFNAANQILYVENDVEPNVEALASFSYDVSGNRIQAIDPEGKITEALYDERDLPWKLTDAVGTTLEVEREYFFNEDGLLSSHLEPFRNGIRGETFRHYDGFDRIESITGSGYGRVEDEFDSSGRVTKRSTFGKVGTSLVKLNEENYIYDDWHNGATSVSTVTYSEDGSQVLRTITHTTDYAPSSRPKTLSLNGSVYAQFEYTEWGAPLEINDGLATQGNKETWDYDPVTGYIDEHVQHHFDPISQATIQYTRTFETDPAGRLTEVTYTAPGETDRVTKYGYDSLDNVVRVENSNGIINKRVFGYDSRVLEIHRDVDESTGAAVSFNYFHYSCGGRVTAAQDNRGIDTGKSVDFYYDERGRRKQEVFKDGSSWQWTYLDGNFIDTVTTPTGKIFDYTYNDRGFPSSRTITLGTTTLRYDWYTWDPLGYLKSVTKLENSEYSTVSFLRDSSGKVLEETQAGGTVHYTRDSLGRLERLKGPSDYFRQYSYDNYHRVKTVHDGLGSSIGTQLAELKYLGAGRNLREMKYKGGTAGTLQVGRNGFGQVNGLETTYGGTPLVGFTYDFDDLGRTLYEQRYQDNSHGDAYFYDSLNRIEDFVRDSHDPVAHSGNLNAPISFGEKKHYNLDPDHHRESVVTTQGAGGSSTETYITHPDRDHYTNINGVIRTQDLSGNLLTHGNREFVYDALDQLIEVKEYGSTYESYKYDPLGRRIEKNTTYGPKVTYIYAGPWLIEEYRENSGYTELDALHFHANGVDDVFMSRRKDHGDLDNDSYTAEFLDLFLHRNKLNSVTELSLSSGQIVESYRYDVYGKPTIKDKNGNVVSTQPSANPFLFTGREWDSQVGYYHYRARTYDPATGTFLQEDPLGFVDGLNPVAYVMANPAMFGDPMGTSALSDALNGMMDFFQENRDLLGEVTSFLLDLLGPLTDLIDLLSSVTGYDINGWIQNGFRELEELSWWERLSGGAVAVLAVAGGAIAMLAKVKKIMKKLDAFLDKLKKSKKSKKYKQQLEQPLCFVAGTLILMSTGMLQPIEAIEVGDVVSAEKERHSFGVDPELQSPHVDHYAQIVNEENWRVIKLVLEDEKGEIDAKVTLLRPSSWVKKQGATVGETTFVSFEEIHVQGEALVLEILPCPEIGEHGNGNHVVTATVERTAKELYDLYLEGQDLPIRGTPEHPFFSETRGSWIPMGSLHEGELLRTSGCPVKVEAVKPLGHGGVVYNFEVQRSHTYRLGSFGVLVHNNHDEVEVDLGSPGRRRNKDGSPKSRAEAAEGLQNAKYNRGKKRKKEVGESEDWEGVPPKNRPRRQEDIANDNASVDVDYLDDYYDDENF